MKRIYFIAIFILFLILVVIGFNYSTTTVSGGAVISTNNIIPREFTSFGIVAATVLVLTSYLLIRHVKREEE